jgi:hydrogenase maturation factor HypF (carbamoyltransferase family)
MPSGLCENERQKRAHAQRVSCGSCGCHNELKTTADHRKLLEQESKEQLDLQFKSLLEPFVPKTANCVSTEPLPA